MKLIVVVVLVALAILLIKSNSSPQRSVKRQSEPKLVAETDNTQTLQTISAFVPYWSVASINQLQNPINNDRFTDLYYFGVTITQAGDIDKNDSGFINLKKVDGTGSHLVVRLIDQTIVDSILDNKNIATKAASEVTELAKSQGFEGILIDLEYSALAAKQTKSNITDTVKMFVSKGHENGLSVGATIYGDTFYRGRPYDVKKIGEVVDEVVVMAYDFHKSKSLPGPLFPFEKKTYGYSFKELVGDFTNVVSANKLTIAYGMYGYQWETDNQKRPIKRASAIPYRNFDTLKDKCSEPDCVVTIDQISKELTVVTKLTNGLIITHGETPSSIQTKIDFAQKSNINRSILWTASYW